TGRHWLMLCDVPTCTIRHVLPRPGTLFVPAALSADGSVLPVDSTPRAYHWKLGNEITFWDFTKQTCVRKNAVKGGVTLTPSPDGRWLASGEYGKISLYDATTQERVDTWNDLNLSRDDGNSYGTFFSPDSRRLAARPGHYRSGYPTVHRRLIIFDVTGAK